MNENIKISDGVIIGDSGFYITAAALLDKECKRLCEFTAVLDKDSVRKKENIAEYKCAKYRYAVVSLIHSTLYNNNRGRKSRNLSGSHYLFPVIDDLFFTKKPDNLMLYDSIPELEKPDFSLYNALIEFADTELSNYEAKLPNASEWEKVELNGRINGLHFAKECLQNAWQTRGI